MFFRRPKITIRSDAPSFELLRHALSQYGVEVLPDGEERELQSLRMDDIDLLEAIQLVDKFVGAKVDRKILLPATKLNQLAEAIDQTRGSR